MSISSKYELIIFDFDGTLASSEVAVNHAFTEVLYSMGVHQYNYEQCIKKFYGMSLSNVIKCINKEIGISLDIKQVMTKFWPIFTNMIKDKKLLPVAGAEKILAELKKHNFNICVASNGEYNIVVKSLKNTNLMQYFKPEHIYTYNHVGAGKPEPDLFFYAADQFWTDYNKCLVIEDSLIGVTAAKKAKMDVLVISESNNVDNDILRLQPNAIINNLLEIKNYL